jgi:predicted membrane-bound dolichyl-phosphate-mannose-protein mannosyltransferase
VGVEVGGARPTPAAPLARRPKGRPSLGAGLAWVWEREWLVVSLILLVALLLHLFVLPYWTEPYMDEEHYVPEARAILEDGPMEHLEHPALGKLLIAAGIEVLGDDHWGWRTLSVLFAVASIGLFYLICRRLAGRACAVLAAFLLVFESLTFVHSGLATLDGFALTFMLLAFLLYVKDRYVLSGGAIALAGLCKMTGLLVIPVILIHWLVVKRRERSVIELAYMTILPVALFLLLMPVVDWGATGEWSSPIDRLGDMASHHEGLTADMLTPEQLEDISRPWEWILSPIGQLSTTAGGTIALINPLVWLLIVPSMGYMVYEWMKSRSRTALFVLLWFAGICLVWIPLVLITDRVSYLYYFMPAAGAVCLAIGMAMVRIWESRAGGRMDRRGAGLLLGGYLAAAFVAFLFVAPVLKTLDSHVNFLP